MRKNLPFWLVLAVCAVALVASSMLLVDYIRPAPVFCGAEGGCGAVKRTALAHPLGIPMPWFGVGGFLAIAMTQMVAGRRARITQAMFAVFGGIVATGLLVVQGLMGKLCPYCVATDVSALVVMGLSIARAVKGWDPPAAKPALGFGALGVVAAVAAPTGIGMSKRVIPLDVPAVIADEMRKTPPGKVTVVDFVDFECPFCRMTHADLAPLLEARKDKVRVARKHVPLRMHPHAMDAARAACCAEAQGKGDAIVEALFTTEPEKLTPEGCVALASAHGLDAKKFEECMRDPATDARIKADAETFRAAKGHGLPTLFIDGARLEGAQDRETLEGTLDGAIKAL